MSKIKASIELVETTNEINNKILKALKPQVNKYLKGAFTKIKNQLSDIVISAIINSPEYQSLLSGDLKAEFGLPDSASRLDYILNFWKNITFKYNPVSIKGNQFAGSFSLSMIKDDYSDILSSSAAVLITEKGTELNWLEWLLLFGNQTIIKDYVVMMGANPRSRTGMAVMRGITNGKWSVPNEFAGVQGDNWITRAIDSVDDEITNLIKKNMVP